MVEKAKSKTRVVNLRRERFDVLIARPSIWGNPFKIGRDGTREEVIAKYEKWILGNDELLSQVHELKGKKLGCYCFPLKCHGDVLRRLADGSD